MNRHVSTPVLPDDAAETTQDGIARVNWPEEVPLPPAMRNPFRYFDSSSKVIRLAVMMLIRYPLSLRKIEDLLFEQRIDICYETVRYWRNRFAPMFAAAIRNLVARSRSR